MAIRPDFPSSGLLHSRRWPESVRLAGNK
jgi:hypothetical protein